MAYQYYNPNPFHRFVGDCTIRAICKLTDQDWDSVYVGTAFEGFLYKNMPSGNSVWGTYLERMGYTQHIIPNAYLRGYTVRDFANEHPHGKYLLVLDEHVVTVVDGDYYDTLDPGDEIPRYYWTKGETVSMESILKTISHMIGPSEDYDYFDTDLIIHINTAFSRLCQLGVGPSEPFHIEDENDEWTDFMEQGNMEDIKTFIYLNVKHDFDPPQNSFLMDALEKKIEKLEWLLNSVAEVGY